MVKKVKHQQKFFTKCHLQCPFHFHCPLANKTNQKAFSNTKTKTLIDHMCFIKETGLAVTATSVRLRGMCTCEWNI